MRNLLMIAALAAFASCLTAQNTVTLGVPVLGQVPTSDVQQGAVDAPIYGFSLTRTGATGTVEFTALTATQTAAATSAMDADWDEMKLYHVALTGTLTLLDTITASPLSFSFTGVGLTLGQPQNFVITVDVAAAATVGRTFQLSVANAGVTVSNATVTGGPLTGNTHTIIAPTGAQMQVADPTPTLISSGSTYDLAAAQGNTPVAGQNYTFTIRSAGAANLELTGNPEVTVTAGGNCNVSVTTQPSRTSIPATESEDFVILVDPINAGAFSFSVFILNNSPNNPYAFTVNGNAVAATTPAELQASRSGPGTIASGATDTIATSTDGVPINLTYVLENVGGTTLTFGSPAVQLAPGTGSPNITFGSSSPANGSTLASGVTTNLDVVVTPNGTGPWTATVTINSDATTNPYTFTISGNATAAPAPELQVSRSGTIASGGTDPISPSTSGIQIDLTYVLENTGTAQLTFGNPAVNVTAGTGTPGVNVATSPANNSTLAVGVQTNLVIEITPSGAGNWSVNVTIASDAITNPYTFTISGNATATPAPALEVRVGGTVVANGGTSTVFGSVDGQQTDVQVDLENIGNAVLNWGTPDTVEITGSTGGPTTALVGLPGAGTTLAVGANDDFTVQITPAGAGAWSVTLAIYSDGSTGGVHTMTLSGTAQATAAPIISVLRAVSAVADGSTDNLGGGLGTAAFTVTYTIRNEGSAALNLIGVPDLVALTNAVNCSVAVTTAPGTPVASGGATTTFVVTVTPAGAGALSFDVSIDSDDTATPTYSFSVTGNTEAAGGGGGGSKKKSGCTTDTGHSFLLLALLGVLGAAMVSTRLRRA